ncbi:MAG: hypothetical protein CL760_05670 [Chloroflexi bacterium]|nr:hypothetical protein [Chloroflexota bacterium]|tara:strand:- start:1846 stop:2763 length:918 start_codon:yes stop_codon:yes gene_type:complete
MQLKGQDVNKAEFVDYFLPHFPEIESKFKDKDKCKMYTNRFDFEPKVLDKVYQLLKANLAPSGFEFNYIAECNLCELSNNINIEVNEYSLFNNELQDYMKKTWTDYFHFKIRSRRDLSEAPPLFYYPIEDFIISYLEYEEAKEDKDFISKEEFQEAEDGYLSAAAAVMTYCSTFSVTHSDDPETEESLNSVVNDILLDNDNLEDMFLFNKGERISDKELDYIKKYSLEINLETYVKEYKITRKSRIFYHDVRECFVHYYTDALADNMPVQMYDDKDYHSAEELYHIFEHAEIHGIKNFGISLIKR